MSSAVPGPSLPVVDGKIEGPGTLFVIFVIPVTERHGGSEGARRGVA